MADSSKKKIRKWTIKVDRNLCIGAASCIAVAPKAYKLDEENIAVILDTADQETDGTLLDSAKACPVAAIIIKDENGKQIYP
jgi:ferredoxin